MKKKKAEEALATSTTTAQRDMAFLSDAVRAPHEVDKGIYRGGNKRNGGTKESYSFRCYRMSEINSFLAAYSAYFPRTRPSILSTRVGS